MNSKLDGDGLKKHGGRPPVNLVIILDVSGSMDSSFADKGDLKKLEVAKTSLITGWGSPHIRITTEITCTAIISTDYRALTSIYIYTQTQTRTMHTPVTFTSWAHSTSSPCRPHAMLSYIHSTTHPNTHSTHPQPHTSDKDAYAHSRACARTHTHMHTHTCTHAHFYTITRTCPSKSPLTRLCFLGSLLPQLTPNDRLAIATFSDSSAVIQAMSDVSAVDMAALKTRVSELVTIGGTSLMAVGSFTHMHTALHTYTHAYTQRCAIRHNTTLKGVKAISHSREAKGVRSLFCN